MSGKQRHLRKRRALDEEDLPDGPDAEGEEGGQPHLTAEDIRLLQKQRQRHGVRGWVVGAVGKGRWPSSCGKVTRLPLVASASPPLLPTARLQ